MPSPTSTTVPTLRVSVVSSNRSIDDLMMLTISSERMAIGGSPSGAMAGCGAAWLAGAGSGDELVAEPLEASADAGVEEAATDLDGQAADERGVDLGPE